MEPDYDAIAAELLPLIEEIAQVEKDRGYSSGYIGGTGMDDAEEDRRCDAAKSALLKAVARRMRELVETECDRLISHAELMIESRDKRIGELKAELAALRQTNRELWGALTPEKRHELNLAAKDAK